ncbi:MAG: TetR/AcrR family transcriptional regulator [Candidatus Thermoplasmatota archaeon]|nr:TetR/AcrR family transcriptional regulator [Candidatus Thermoplasmatota archaeon]
MSRVTKKREDRREEFIEVSKRLFNKKGYEYTTVDDIVDAVGVAKGLFYYYFESKETLLDVITNTFIEEIRQAIADAISREGLSAIVKMELLLEASGAIKMKSMALVEYFHEPRNKHLHLAAEERVMKFLVPSVEEIIRQGVREGVFDTKYPHYAALAYIGAGMAISHERFDRLSRKEIVEMVAAYQTLTEKMLGARPGTFDIYQRLVKKNLAGFTSSDRRSSGRPKR